MISQRTVSTSSSSADAASNFRLNMAGSAATAVAVGSIAWYYHMYGPQLQAMTEAEEGLVISRSSELLEQASNAGAAVFCIGLQQDHNRN